MSVLVVVTEGASLGARLVVDETPKVVGRARDADLVVADLSISRRHLELHAVGETLVVRCLPGASPFVVDAVSRHEASVAAGSKIVIGNSVLTVATNLAAAAPDIEITDAGSLLTGFGADVRGLASVVALVDALEAAREREALERALSNWSASHLGSVAVTVHPADAPNHLDAPDGATLLVRCATSTTSALSFTLPPGSTLDDATRRFALVAARLFAARLTERQLTSSTEDDRAALRIQAVGSATEFLGQSQSALNVASLVGKLADSQATVLVLGESGVGKTFAARLIHEAGRRHSAPLRVVNCAAIPENLLESELFGHERGAFTGADAARAGAFESAGEGTILLDEIAELPLASQAKLLHVLEDRRFSRLGSAKPVTLRARIITATNRELTELVEAGRFRSDLYFRISVVTLRVPSLRERAADLPMLAQRMLTDLSASAGRRVHAFSPRAMDVLIKYPWPGNVRELRNAIEHALVLGDGPIVEVSDLPETVRAVVRASTPSAAPPRTAEADENTELVALPANLEWLERRAIDAALRATGGNRTHAAAMLGINRATLYKKLPVGDK